VAGIDRRELHHSSDRSLAIRMHESRFVGDPFEPLPARLVRDSVQGIVQPIVDPAFSFAP
jgi:hypothetical protein